MKEAPWLLLTSNPNKTVAKNPPINPSQVFFGESCREREGGITDHTSPHTSGALPPLGIAEAIQISATNQQVWSQADTDILV